MLIMDQKNKFKKNVFLKLALIISLAAPGIIGLNPKPTMAQDPFRTKNERKIGEHTEKAFKTIFLEGDYKTVEKELILAAEKEPNEPLTHAIKASLAYTEEDWESIKKYATKTLETAQSLSSEDPVRGNIYLAVGHFLDGAYIYEKQGAFNAINKLQLVFKHFDVAEDIDANDPELNLIKGYIDLLLAVNLPFSSPEEAIARFETYAAPNYLVERGLAVAYRDLKQYDKALKYADKALNTAPDNPEHYYLKGQILRKIGKEEQNIDVLEDALKNFEVALNKSEQLPQFVLKSLKRETSQTEAKITEIKATRANKSIDPSSNGDN